MKPRTLHTPASLGAGALLVAGLSGCRAPGDWAELADDEVYRVVAERRAQLELDEGFTIDPPDSNLRHRLDDGEAVDIGSLGLAEMLTVAAENSRDFQRQKELLYLAALDFTLERFQFANQYDGLAGAVASGTTGGSEFVEVDGLARLTRFLGQGAQLIADLGLSLVKNVSTGDSWSLVSDVGFSFTQPFLRGFGRRIAQENLTQAERNVIYEVRSFERFRRTFAFDVASRYFRILQQQNIVENVEANYENLQLLRERNEALSQAGRLSEIQVDQARQDELRSKNSLVEEVARTQSLVDELKLFLGLPIDARLGIDSRELETIDFEFDWEALAEDRIVELALIKRLDFQTAVDRLVDRERKVVVAANALETQLDLNLDYQVTSTSNQPLKFDFGDANWTAALDLDLPLQRVAERNAYRSAIVDVQVAYRAAQQSADTIRRDLRQALRDLRAAGQSYTIQQNSVMLSERRVESTQLNFDAGRATTRDLLEAREDQLAAQNAETRALVDYHLALLALFRDLEVLLVTADGLEPDRVALAEILGS